MQPKTSLYRQLFSYSLTSSSTQPIRNFHSFQENRHSWSVLNHIYQRQFKSSNKKYACFLLNISDQCHHQFDKYKFIWDEADFKVAVDGSANYLYKHGLIHSADIISGDFDSIDNKLIQRLQSPRTPVKPVKNTNPSLNQSAIKIPQLVETPSQRETDFTKAIHVAMGLKPDLKFFFGLYHSDGKRIDHLFGLINTLHLIKKRIILINIHGDTISWLLQPGAHTILKPRGQEQCSFLPFTGPAEVKTNGFQYNAQPLHPLGFGGLISTSNSCNEQRDKLIVETNRELLLSINLHK